MGLSAGKLISRGGLIRGHRWATGRKNEKSFIVFIKTLFNSNVFRVDEILSPLMKCEAAGGIEINATFYVFGAKFEKLHVRKVIKKADAEQGWKQKKKQLDNDKNLVLLDKFFFKCLILFVLGITKWAYLPGASMRGFCLLKTLNGSYLQASTVSHNKFVKTKFTSEPFLLF